MALFDVSRLVLTSCTTTTQSFVGGWGGWGGVWSGGGPGHYVVTPTRVEVELDCDNYDGFKEGIPSYDCEYNTRVG